MHNEAISSITFINKKSSDRVDFIVELMKNPLPPSKRHLMKTDKLLAKFEEDPMIVIKNQDIFINQKVPNDCQKLNIEPIRPFLYHQYPPAIEKQKNNMNSMHLFDVKRDFLLESRMENIRILNNFQDRLASELALSSSSLRSVSSHLAKDFIAKVDNPEPNKDTLRRRFNTLLHRTQKTVSDNLDIQQRTYKIAADMYKFGSIQDQNDNQDIFYPFSFLQKNYK